MSEHGQATVEWMGLVVGLALALGAVAAGGRAAARGEGGPDGLGEALAGRMTCAVREKCRVGRLERRGAGPGPGPGPAPAPGRAPAPAQPRRAGIPGVLVKRTWLLCLGYRRWQYDRAHPRPPLQGVPLRDTARMVNECVNPLSFLFG